MALSGSSSDNCGFRRADGATTSITQISPKEVIELQVYRKLGTGTDSSYDCTLELSNSSGIVVSSYPYTLEENTFLLKANVDHRGVLHVSIVPRISQETFSIVVPGVGVNVRLLSGGCEFDNVAQKWTYDTFDPYETFECQFLFDDTSKTVRSTEAFTVSVTRMGSDPPEPRTSACLSQSARTCNGTGNQRSITFRWSTAYGSILVTVSIMYRQQGWASSILTCLKPPECK